MDTGIQLFLRIRQRHNRSRRDLPLTIRVTGIDVSTLAGATLGVDAIHLAVHTHVRRLVALINTPIVQATIRLVRRTRDQTAQEIRNIPRITARGIVLFHTTTREIIGQCCQGNGLVLQLTEGQVDVGGQEGLPGRTLPFRRCGTHIATFVIETTEDTVVTRLGIRLHESAVSPIRRLSNVSRGIDRWLTRGLSGWLDRFASR